MRAFSCCNAIWTETALLLLRYAQSHVSVNLSSETGQYVAAVRLCAMSMSRESVWRCRVGAELPQFLPESNIRVLQKRVFFDWLGVGAYLNWFLAGEVDAWDPRSVHIKRALQLRSSKNSTRSVWVFPLFDFEAIDALLRASMDRS